MYRCPLPKKKAARHMTLFACDGVSMWHVVLCVVSVSSCGGCVVSVVGAGKKGRGKHTVKQKQKGVFPKPLFPFSFFPPLFLPFFSPCLPLFHYHTLLIHTLTCFSFFTNGYIRCEPKTQMTQHLILFIVFSFCPNYLFIIFIICR